MTGAKRYQRKPTPFDANQWQGDNLVEMRKLTALGLGPETHQNFMQFSASKGQLFVAADNKWLPVDLGDWVILNEDGLSTCPDEDFRAQFEEVPDAIPFEPMPIKYPCVRCGHAFWDHTEPLPRKSSPCIVEHCECKDYRGAARIDKPQQ